MRSWNGGCRGAEAKPATGNITIVTAAEFQLPLVAIPDDIFPNRKHPDIRIARRANTIASLARVISERKVSKGLRRTLLTQARRLERLAAERLKDSPAEITESSGE